MKNANFGNAQWIFTLENYYNVKWVLGYPFRDQVTHFNNCKSTYSNVVNHSYLQTAMGFISTLLKRLNQINLNYTKYAFIDVYVHENCLIKC